MYSVLLPYHDRLKQFNKTVESYCKNIDDLKKLQFIVIIDEKSQKDARQIKDILNGLNSKVTINKPSFNPCGHYNLAAKLADGEFFILTSPEVMPTGDIINGLDEEFAKDQDCYVICSCIAEGDNGKLRKWYQHSNHRPMNYHFCTALHRDTWEKIDGFDDSYARGIGYDDNDVVMKLRHHKINMVTRDDLLTIHQYHGKPLEKTSERKRLVNINKGLFKRKWKQ